MSDQLVEGTVEGQPEVQSEEPETSSPSYLTKEEAEAYFRKMEDSLMGRQADLLGKGTEKLRQRLASLEEHVELQRSTGITVNDADVERMRNRIISTSLTEQGEPKPQSAQADAQQSAAQGIDPQRVNSIATNMLQSMGVTFEQNAPELKMIKTNGDYVEYLDSLTQAATAWKKRNSDKPNPESRIPGIVSGNTATDREAAINQELDKLYRSPQKNMTRINELTKELQSIVRK
jgi:hypothetical protein